MPFWDKVPGTLRISIMWLQSLCMARSMSQKNLYLPAKKHGKRLLQSKLEVDYLSAWGFWLKIFWLDVICIPQSQGCNFNYYLTRGLKQRKEKRKESFWIKSLCRDTTSPSGSGHGNKLNTASKSQYNTRLSVRKIIQQMCMHHWLLAFIPSIKFWRFSKQKVITKFTTSIVLSVLPLLPPQNIFTKWHWSQECHIVGSITPGETKKQQTYPTVL